MIRANVPKGVLTNIIRDHKIASRIIEDILTNGTNKEVTKENYLYPQTSEEDRFIEVPSGEFHYFRRIREALEAALSTGEIPAGTVLPENTPDYLVDLVRKV